MKQTQSEEILWRHLRDLPYFRAMVRAVEDSFYQDLELPGKILDVGCGDGHFASVAFKKLLDVGLDPWWAPLKEVHQRGAYRMVIQADGAQSPFEDASFDTAMSNSVLEHIPHVDDVLRETARLVKPGGLFVFCVPNHRFPQQLFGRRVFMALGLKGAAEWYTRLFQRISRHVHCDSREVWQERLDQAGFTIERAWDYFGERELHRMERGHAFGLPALIVKKLTGRWILVQNRFNLWLPYLITRRSYREPFAEDGVYSFYITRRK